LNHYTDFVLDCQTRHLPESLLMLFRRIFQSVFRLQCVFVGNERPIMLTVAKNICAFKLREAAGDCKHYNTKMSTYWLHFIFFFDVRTKMLKT